MVNEKFERFRKNISDRGLSIHDEIEIGHHDLWIPIDALEALLNEYLSGLSLRGFALRTRSRVVKEAICHALGYPVPATFSRTKPRFLGQMLDCYIQKSHNLQIWNEEISSERRYAIIAVGNDDIIRRVKVVTGENLARLDKTGKLTSKYQARALSGGSCAEIVVAEDTDNLRSILREHKVAESLSGSPIAIPNQEQLLPISSIFDRLKRLVGRQLVDSGFDQERNRGAALHKLVCKELGYANYQDDGKFPDIRNQLLEVKLQTSPTIDLGFALPNSQELLDIAPIGGRRIRYCDVRYAVFLGWTDGTKVELTHLVVTTGESFFERFRQFEGKVINRKLQIPLPNDFFEV